MTPPPPPAKRTDPLNRGEIARAALAMVDRDGVERFSMRRLANDLGVTTMAVYHHFENKAEILQAAADQVWIEVVVSIPAVDDPVESLVQSFLAARRTFHRHPDLAPYAFAAPTTEEAVHAAAMGITALVERAGFTGRAAGDLYFAVASYTFGSALLHAERMMLDRVIRRPVSDLADLAEDPVPVGSGAAYQSVREAMGNDPDLVRFERALRSIVDGLVEQHRRREPDAG